MLTQLANVPAKAFYAKMGYVQLIPRPPKFCGQIGLRSDKNLTKPGMTSMSMT